MPYNDYYNSSANYDDQFEENYYSYIVAPDIKNDYNYNSHDFKTNYDISFKKSDYINSKKENIDNKNNIDENFNSYNDNYKKNKSENIKSNHQKILYKKIYNKKYRKYLLTSIYAVTIILSIIYYTSFVNVRFSNVQNLRKELSLIQKENEQMQVNIEKNLNYNAIEQIARDELGLEKYSSKQLKTLIMPRNNFVEIGHEKIIEDEETVLQRIIRHIKN